MASKAQQLPKQLRGTYISAHMRARYPQPCEHGHYDCSCTSGGVCTDELLAIIEAEHEEEGR